MWRVTGRVSLRLCYPPCGSLWDGDPPPSARKTLQIYAHRLRRTLDDGERLKHTPGGYARSQRHRLAEVRLNAMEAHAAIGLELGRHQLMTAQLAGLVAQHPYREGLRAQLMLALYRSGRQAEALEVYRSGARVLAEELGIEPPRTCSESISRSCTAIRRWSLPRRRSRRSRPAIGSCRTPYPTSSAGRTICAGWTPTPEMAAPW